jgi:hypothetical protein
VQGTIYRCGKVAEFVIVAIADGDYSLVELFGEELGVGDVVAGSLDQEGAGDLRRISDGTPVASMVQGAGMSLRAAIAALDAMGG